MCYMLELDRAANVEILVWLVSRAFPLHPLLVPSPARPRRPSARPRPAPPCEDTCDTKLGIPARRTCPLGAGFLLNCRKWILLRYKGRTSRLFISRPAT